LTKKKKQGVGGEKRKKVAIKPKAGGGTYHKRAM